MELGRRGVVVPIIGLGGIGKTGFGDANMYGKADDQEAVATIHRSPELGGHFFDIADLFSLLENERLMQKRLWVAVIVANIAKRQA